MRWVYEDMMRWVYECIMSGVRSSMLPVRCRRMYVCDDDCITAMYFYHVDV